MSLVKIFLLLISINLLASNQLKNNYFINNNYVLLSNIIKNPTKDAQLFTINQNKHSKRVKAKELVALLKKLGYTNFYSKHSYIQFTQKSPINIDKIELELRNSYSKTYKDINIKSIIITPRTYLDSLPQKYEIILNKKSFLNKKGTLYLKTSNNKKIFFNYLIDAQLPVIIARDTIRRGSELSTLNTQKKSIILDKFRAMPLQEMPKSMFQSKTKIKASTVLTSRDVVGLNLVKRGENIHVTIIDANIAISFMAKANQNGRYGDTIVVLNKSGKKIKVLVTGKNSAEIR